jgi:ABC-type branched-subunit amino acid transport system ATPase component
MTSPALDVQGIVVGFSGLRALDHVDLTVEVGELRAVIGPNGAGKTTLFNVISGLVKPVAGTISIFGEDVTSVAIHRRVQSGLSRTFQVPQLFNGIGVVENVMIALQENSKSDAVGKDRLKGSALEVLRRYGLEGTGPERPEHLSHGLRRRLEIALTVCQSPRILLLDEPAAGLARDEAAELLDFVRELSADLTMVLIEHDIELVLAVSDRITVLDRGQVIAEGAPAEIRGNAEVRALYLGDTG